MIWLADPGGMRQAFLILALVCFIGARLAVAKVGHEEQSYDKVERKNGQILYGRVVGETANGVRFEPADAVGGAMIFQIPKSQIRFITRAVREGPAYCVIEIKGEIGKDVTADAFKQALSAAWRLEVKYVILFFDSPGGLIEERDRLLEVMREPEFKDFHYVAHVKRAMSAAAVIALACPKIFMDADGAIGAAVPYAKAPGELPQLITEKFRSAIRATERAAAEAGGHSDLWIRGMSEGDLELAVIQENGKPRLVEASTAKGGTVIKRKGEILTLTAKEALASGLSTATVEKVGDMVEHLGLKAWHNVGAGPQRALVGQIQNQRDRVRWEQERLVRAQARAAYVERIRPNLAGIDSRLPEVVARYEASKAAVEKLRYQYAAEAEVLRAEYQAAIVEGRRKQNADQWIAYVNEADKIKFANLRERYEPAITEAEATRDAAYREWTLLYEQRKQLIASIPPEE